MRKSDEFNILISRFTCISRFPQLEYQRLWNVICHNNQDLSIEIPIKLGPWNLCDLGGLLVGHWCLDFRLVGKYTDQTYCMYTVQNCWSVYLPTNNIAHTPCNTVRVSLYLAPTILLNLNAMITLRGLNFPIEVK